MVHSFFSWYVQFFFGFNLLYHQNVIIGAKRIENPTALLYKGKQKTLHSSPLPRAKKYCRFYKEFQIENWEYEGSFNCRVGAPHNKTERRLFQVSALHCSINSESLFPLSERGLLCYSLTSGMNPRGEEALS